MRSSDPVLRDERLGPIELHPSVVVEPGAVLIGPLRIDRGCSLGAYSVVGTRAGKRDAAPGGGLFIGANVHLGAHVVIERGTTADGTVLASDVHVLSHAYLAHDVVLCERVVVAARANLGGRVLVMADANVGMAACVHQRSTIGRGAMVGMAAVVAGDVPPFAVVSGRPARLRRFNALAAQRLGIGPEETELLGEALVATMAGRQLPRWPSEYTDFLSRHTRPLVRPGSVHTSLAESTLGPTRNQGPCAGPQRQTPNDRP